MGSSGGPNRAPPLACLIPDRVQSSEESSPGQVKESDKKKMKKNEKTDKSKKDKKTAKNKKKTRSEDDDDEEEPDADHDAVGKHNRDDDGDADGDGDEGFGLEGYTDLFKHGDEPKKSMKRPAAKRAPRKRPSKNTDEVWGGLKSI